MPLIRTKIKSASVLFLVILMGTVVAVVVVVVVVVAAAAAASSAASSAAAVATATFEAVSGVEVVVQASPARQQPADVPASQVLKHVNATFHPGRFAALKLDITYLAHRVVSVGTRPGSKQASVAR